MTPPSEVVFLFDVDNTMRDNDRVQDDLRNHLKREFGAETRGRYCGAIFEEMCAEFGYSDYLGALQRYRLENLCDPRLLMMSSLLVDYPFANRLYPGSLEALEHVAPGGQQSSCAMATRGLPIAQSSTLRAMGSGRGPCAELNPQQRAGAQGVGGMRACPPGAKEKGFVCG
jgi:hypothetical protein